MSVSRDNIKDNILDQPLGQLYTRNLSVFSDQHGSTTKQQQVHQGQLKIQLQRQGQRQVQVQVQR